MSSQEHASKDRARLIARKAPAQCAEKAPFFLASAFLAISAQSSRIVLGHELWVYLGKQCLHSRVGQKA